eukprot:jgi/Mesvir1/21683/Mv04104-RA.1
MTDVCLGVDGGGTKTICIAVDESTGKVMGRAAAPSCNHNSVGDAAACAALSEAISRCLKESNSTVSNISSVCLALSGVDRPDDIVRVNGYIKSILPDLPASVPRLVKNDATSALASGTNGELRGCVIIAGTGTVTIGFAPSGETMRVAGWGPLGDRGSGYTIACDGLSALARAHDGRGRPTTLTGAILAHVGLSKPEDIIGWRYKDDSWARVAALAPTVLDCWQRGDEVATAIITNAVDELVHSVATLIRRMGLPAVADRDDGTFPLVCSGGLLTEGEPFTQHFEAKLHEVVPEARVIHAKVEAAVGAAWLARKALATQAAMPAGLC